MRVCLRRREFIAGLGTAAAWPFAARAQQGDRVRRIGVLMSYDENDPVAKTQVSAFTQTLPDLGWADGRNVRIDLRWARGDINRIRAFAQELVGLQPDIILTSSTPATPLAFQRFARRAGSGQAGGKDRTLRPCYSCLDSAPWRRGGADEDLPSKARTRTSTRNVSWRDQRFSSLTPARMAARWPRSWLQGCR